jgi:hypothetical protein
MDVALRARPHSPSRLLEVSIDLKMSPLRATAARGSHDLLLFTAAALPKEGLQAARGRQQAAGGGREEAVG